ncbi:MAG: type II toxin-antitoxin system RelE/ParE family toxin [Syntrophobacteraceae bacterium]|nr:type II toxin-antitoxin system RelE/ParE family toxin [Syntrophobacteraceae bacterium]
MEWEIEYTDEFGQWWDGLTEGEQESVRAGVKLLADFGPGLPFPHSSGVKQSEYGNMRELRIQPSGRPYRVLYAFDPRRCAILLIGGVKTGEDRWYDEFVPIADRLYREHLETLSREGLINGS